MIFEEESHRYLRDIYCDECWEKFLRAESVNFTDDYIAQREKEYYTSWFESEMLSDSERLDAIKRYYLTKKALDAESLAVDRYMFFAESEDFFEYVEKRVRE
ncbi:MAG: hypothetical protein J6R00_04775 [Lentisphaeria bacterium]|nr:hypothetical protein [Lentisphaeria bacterium]